jgi:hypothetical protein
VAGGAQLSVVGGGSELVEGLMAARHSQRDGGRRASGFEGRVCGESARARDGAGWQARQHHDDGTPRHTSTAAKSEAGVLVCASLVCSCAHALRVRPYPSFQHAGPGSGRSALSASQSRSGVGRRQDSASEVSGQESTATRERAARWIMGRNVSPR